MSRARTTNTYSQAMRQRCCSSRAAKVDKCTTTEVRECACQTLVSIAARGRNRRAKPGSGVQTLGASEFDPSFQKFGVSETPSQRPLGAPERLSGPPGRLFRGLGEVCLFSKERGKKVGHSEAPKRRRFPGCSLRGSNPRVPTLRPQLVRETPSSGSHSSCSGNFRPDHFQKNCIIPSQDSPNMILTS